MQHFEGKVHAERSEPRLECPADGLQIICVCRQMSARALSWCWASEQFVLALVMQSINIVLFRAGDLNLPEIK